MSAPADSAEGRWLARLRERRREGALHVAALEDVEALIAERDQARAEVERLRHHASGMEDELRYGEEVCANIVDERDEALSQVKAWQAEELSRRTERDEARAEVERLRARIRSVDRSTDYNGKAFSDDGESQEDLAIVAADERDEARAEVERLREALRAIAAGFDPITGSVDDPSAKQVDGYYRGYAMAALEKGGK